MIKIIPASLTDLDFVYAAINILEETEFNQETFKGIYQTLIDSSGYFPFIITHNQEEIGFMGIYIQPMLHHCAKVAEVQELIVLPEFRSAGAGKTAITFAKTFAREQGCEGIELTSNLKRKDAHRFYLSNGFAQTHYKFVCTFLKES